MQCAKQGVSAKQGSRVAAITHSCGQSVAIPSEPQLARITAVVIQVEQVSCEDICTIPSGSSSKQ